ncbi:MAG: APC family permease [Vallitaleaceae bacterium]|nr:APC family permease [Vallitaleaceae bacterium]
MFRKLKRVLIGEPLRDTDMSGEKFGILWGLPILSSDAISSVAYAGQEILMVLIPVIGVLAYAQLSYISFAIIALLIILTFSYRQTIEHYPNGGGAFIVAKENLGIIAGVTAGAALTVGYVMTVAVSVSSGVEQVTSAFMPLKPYTIPICIVIILLLTLGNLRGIGESSKIFGIPAYAFIIAMLAMIVVGIVKYLNGYIPPQPTIKSVGEPITMILMLKAFSSGCTALTGVEAVSNAVPNFKAPSVKHARNVLLLLSLIILVLFGGTSLLANLYHVVPGHRAMLILMAEVIFGRGFMFYYLTATTFVILLMGANTAYSGFPLLVAVMAKEGYFPRQLSMRGDRLSYSNGIIFLSAVSILLIVLFKANVTSLLGLYAIGVFISFTLSQTGMFKRWFVIKGHHWLLKALINGLGALVTTIAVLIIAYAKFNQGAWVVVVVIPVLIYCMLKVSQHYVAVKKQLKITPEELSRIDLERDVYKNLVIVPIESINQSSVRALRFAKTISDNVLAFSVAVDEESGAKIKERYAVLKCNIPLIVRYSPYRKVVEPLLNFIESEEYGRKKGDMITVILPQFSVRSWWHKFLHNHTRLFVQGELLKHKHIVVAIMPLQLREDKIVLKEIK